MATPDIIRSPLPRRFSALFALLSLLSLFSGIAQSQPITAPLPTLRFAREVHALASAEADRHYPVHLRAVVTYYDRTPNTQHSLLFVHDRSGGVFVRTDDDFEWPAQPPRAGTILDIQGISSAGEFAPTVKHPTFQILGQSPTLPVPVRATLIDLQSGSRDCEWVEIEGVVQTVSSKDNDVTLQLATRDGLLNAITVRQPGVDYNRFINATLLVRGNAAAFFNGDRQITGSRIFFPDLNSLTVEEAAPADPFSVPIRSVADLSHFVPGTRLPHRIHIRGTVTLQWPGRTLCVQDETQGLCAESTQTDHLAVGEVADVIGFSAVGGYRPTLRDAIYKRAAGTTSVAPRPVTADQALTGNFDSQIVQIEGRLIGRDLTANDVTLVLSSGKTIFSVLLPAGTAAPEVASISLGSTLQVTGICSVQIDRQGTSRGEGGAKIQSFKLLLRSAHDMQILETPSFWTASRILLLLVIVLAITAAVLGWVVILRRRVEQQTRVIRESEERFRHLAQHDSLTGLPTRTLLHDRLQSALDRASRFHTKVALLMLDLDNFKGVNDVFGHAAGDLTLCATAERVSQTVRRVDTVARMGGDEFVVLLCDLQEDKEAEEIAAKIVRAMSLPIRIGQRDLEISVSIGVCAVPHGSVDPDQILKGADKAMYHAKAQGRNCFRAFTGDLESTPLGPPASRGSAHPAKPPVAFTDRTAHSHSSLLLTKSQESSSHPVASHR